MGGDPERLRELLREAHPALSEQHIERLTHQYAIFLAFAGKLSLGTDRDPDAVLAHMNRAIWASGWFCGPRVLDVGSGAGFPAISVAILRSDLEVDLCERSRKKAAFLEYLAAELSLAAVRVRNVGVADLRGRERYRCVSAQAVPAAARSLPLLQSLLEEGGRLLLFLGRSAAKAVARDAEARGLSVVTEPEPWSEQRVLIRAER